jgi:hypothetical protein
MMVGPCSRPLCGLIWFGWTKVMDSGVVRVAPRVTGVVGVEEWVAPARPPSGLRGEPTLASGATFGLDEAAASGNFDAAARAGVPALFPGGVAGWRGEAWRRPIDVFMAFEWLFEWLEAESFRSTRGAFRSCNLSTDLLVSVRGDGSGAGQIPSWLEPARTYRSFRATTDGPC